MRFSKPHRFVRQFPTTFRLFILLAVLILTLTPTLVIYKGLLNHRYLLPIYVVANLLAVKIISDTKICRRQILFGSILLVGLASGNFWVYRQPTATGWDSTLAHLPYYRLRREMLQLIDNQHLNVADIGTSFPNQRSFRLIDLVETDPSVFPSKSSFAELDFSKNRYIFYSNVMNGFSAEELNELKNHWKIVKILRGGQVEIVLYEKLF